MLALGDSDRFFGVNQSSEVAIPSAATITATFLRLWIVAAERGADPLLGTTFPDSVSRFNLFKSALNSAAD